MLENITYVNHLSEEINFGENGLYINNNDLHSYAWAYGSRNNKVSYFNQTIKEITLPIRVKCDTREQGYDIMDRLMETADKDILSKEPGRIIAGGYYLQCYLFKSKKSKYDLQNGVFYADLTVVTDNPSWIKETSQTFNPSSGGSGQDLDFPFDFPYDFASSSTSTELINYGFSDSNFKLTIYGEVTDPSISINGHEYEVTGTIDNGEYLEIDSREKTVTLVQEDGTKVNWFSHRNKDSYIFQKIPSGSSSVLYTGSFVFSITLYEERSEPKWT